jgi:CRP/FNR family transcriptional regulator, cyclic AMP receptor protein
MTIVPYSAKAKIRKRLPRFSVETFLASGGVSTSVVEYRRTEKIYSQGEPAKDVMYIQKGGVKLSVLNELGKEAVVAVLGPGDFLVKEAWLASPFAWGRRARSRLRLY